MIAEFLQELVKKEVKLLTKTGDDLNFTPYEITNTVNGYIFGDKTKTKLESGYDITNNLNLYIEGRWEFKADDRAVVDENLYAIQNVKVSQSQVDMNFTRIQLSYIGLWQEN